MSWTIFQFNNTKFTQYAFKPMVSFSRACELPGDHRGLLYWIVDVDVLVSNCSPEGVEEAERGAIVAADGEMMRSCTWVERRVPHGMEASRT